MRFRSFLFLNLLILTIPSMAFAESSFTPDQNFLINQASNGAVYRDSQMNIVLQYNNRANHRREETVLSESLLIKDKRFPQRKAHITKLPNGKWRDYFWDRQSGDLVSAISTDGKNFQREPGVRYKLQPEDKGRTGIYRVFQYKDQFILIYLGDLHGKNNLRLAVSKDNGMTFKFVKGDVLGDGHGRSNSYVDPFQLVMPDGSLKLFVMRSDRPEGRFPPGQKPPIPEFGIYSFSSTDGINYTLDSKPVLRSSDFKARKVYGLFDPVALLTENNKIRLFVTVGLTPGHGPEVQQGIMSAISK